MRGCLFQRKTVSPDIGSFLRANALFLQQLWNLLLGLVELRHCDFLDVPVRPSGADYSSSGPHSPPAVSAQTAAFQDRRSRPRPSRNRGNGTRSIFFHQPTPDRSGNRSGLASAVEIFPASLCPSVRKSTGTAVPAVMGLKAEWRRLAPALRRRNV